MKYIKLSLIFAIAFFISCAEPAHTQGNTDAAGNQNNITTVSFDGSTARITGTGAIFSNGVLTINQAGTYVLSGRLDNGRILTNIARTDTVRLVLNNLSLNSNTGPAIYSARSREIIIILESGSQNNISDGRVSRNDDHNAAIFVQHSLSIQGSGTLNVNGNYHHGIRAQDYLTINSGTINVTAQGDALRGRDGVIINNGIFNLNAGGDGIQSNNANSDDVGYVTITGGTFNIRAANDGIQAESILTISGGSFNIITGGGSANAPPRAVSFGGGRGGRGFPAPQAPQNPAAESDSMKGLKARTLVFITGGTFNIDSADDGIHSDNDIHIAGGSIQIRTGDDGIHADNNVLISGGDINIIESYEGIEGMTVTITGGNIRVFASDDGINAAGGRTRNDMFIRITGGIVDVHVLATGDTDGLDSNGNIFLEGGTLRVSGGSQIMAGAIDLDGQFVVTGGELITAGAIQSVSSNSTQPVLMVSYNTLQPIGSVISVRDRNGNILLEYTSRTAFSVSGFSSPNFRTGQTYTLFVNGIRQTDIQLNGMITRISNTGGTYNPGGRGFR